MLEIWDALNSLHCMSTLQNRSVCAVSGIHVYFKTAAHLIYLKKLNIFAIKQQAWWRSAAIQIMGPELTAQLEVLCSPGLKRLPLRHKNHKVPGLMATHVWRW